MSFFSAGVALTVVILGLSFTTDAFLANPSVANVYLW